MKKIATADLATLGQQARQSPRLRANSNLHTDLGDPIQRLAIAMEPGTLILPHRHPHTFEVLSALRGRFTVLLFDDGGKVAARAELGTDASVVEIPAGGWHAVLSRDTGAVIFEVKHGPYAPIAEADVAGWSKGRSATELNAWYAVARVGDRM
ncbi:MAG: WbuC family cupin fold metalloprotein [Gammaproteobacteria bacterium]|nr:WbuC family cupin fold metalloprotein [Gammaproteobacteria bacterium]MBU1775707.1 WbuC family cupin fold metalloprotein [Gammaproteobacteria bacterium]MBU1970116.1 WbuC family cupin fold metalloprotein [Gammaproteobacteria bacterium]